MATSHSAAGASNIAQPASSETQQPKTMPGVAPGLSSLEAAELERRTPSVPAITMQSHGQVQVQTASALPNVTFSASMLKYLKQVCSGSLPISSDQAQEIAQSHSAAGEISTASPSLQLPALLSYLSAPANYAQSPIPESANDLSKPLSWYFISSSHNTYLSGNQLYGEASGEAYENVLKRGCRCVEIDVWDGEETRGERQKEREKREEKEREKSRDHGHGGGIAGGAGGLASVLRSEGEGLKNKLAGHLHRHTSSNVSDSAESGQQAQPPAPATTAAASQPGKWTSLSTQMRLEPRVLHGFTLTKDVSFREVCESIRAAAFVNSDLPVIVSLEVHAGATQQAIMVEIMEECWAGMLVDDDTTNCKVLPSPEELKGKILVKVKAAPLPSTVDDGEDLTRKAAEIKLMDSDEGMTSSSEDEKKGLRKITTASSALSTGSVTKASRSDRKKSKKSSIIPSLSALGKYTQAFHFKDLQSREALIPTHVFSLSEKKLMVVHAANSGPSIFSHNKNFLMRAFPSGTRLDSSNLDPAVFWRKGVQMVALNWQKFDAGTMMNEAQFAGTGGWLLKPEGYRGSLTVETKIGSESQLEAMPRKAVQLSITLLAAQGLPMKKSQDKGGRLSPYIKCELHVERSEEVTRQPIAKEGHATEGEYKLKSKNSKTADPDFSGEVLRFPQVHIVEELSFIRFKIMDDVLGRDDLLVWSCIRVDRLRAGYRLVDLLSADGSECDAFLLVKVDKVVN